MHNNLKELIQEMREFIYQYNNDIKTIKEIFSELSDMNNELIFKKLHNLLKLYRLEAGRFSPPGGSLCN